MPKLWGPMLTGLAQGFQNYQQSQEDLAYTRQSRANELASQQLSNQQKAMQLQAQQQQQQEAALQHEYWTSALQSTDNTPQPPSGPVGRASPMGGGGGGGGGGGTQPSALRKSPLSVGQLSDLDKQYNLPTGTAYGLMEAESSGNPNAISSEGAVGLFQVKPDTAAKPGYGLKAFDPRDPKGALGYFAKMYQRAGGDMQKALGYWNAGPTGNPDNDETKAFVPRVMKGMQQFSAANGLDQSKQQPSPAEQVDARSDAGIDAPISVYQQATQAQGHQIQTMLQAGQNAERGGHPELAQSFYAQAQKLQDQQLDLQKKTFDVQKSANEETAKLSVGVKDQSSYNNLQTQIAQNPAMQKAVSGLGLTGNYAQDRNKIDTLASRTETLKDQQDASLKQKEFQLKQQKELRDQQKADQPAAAQAIAQAQDKNRQQTVAQKGIPFVPSISASAPAGTTSRDLEAAKRQVDKQNADYDKNIGKSVQGAKDLQQIAARVYVAVKDGGVQTGGIFNSLASEHAPFLLAQKQQELVKDTNLMVNALAQSNSGGGAARSVFTAAAWKNYEKTKPNMTMGPEAFTKVAHELYVASTNQAQMNAFLDEYRSANPDATVQSGIPLWRTYEQSLGPVQVYDPKEGRMVPNLAGVPTLEDGTPNPNFKDYHDFFRKAQ